MGKNAWQRRETWEGHDKQCKAIQLQVPFKWNCVGDMAKEKKMEPKHPRP